MKDLFHWFDNNKFTGKLYSMDHGNDKVADKIYSMSNGYEKLADRTLLSEENLHAVEIISKDEMYHERIKWNS